VIPWITIMHKDIDRSYETIFTDHFTPTVTLAVDMQIDAPACNAGFGEDSLQTQPNRIPQT
jgi:hypothetical protein